MLRSQINHYGMVFCLSELAKGGNCQVTQMEIVHYQVCLIWDLLTVLTSVAKILVVVNPSTL